MFYIFCVLIPVLSCFFFLILQGTWQYLKTFGNVPSPRRNHGVVVVGQKAYAFGGEYQNDIPIDNVIHCLNLQTGEWTRFDGKGDPPIARSGLAMTAIGHNIYMFGGQTRTGCKEESLWHVYCYNTLDKRWSIVNTEGAPPDPRIHHSMVNVNGQLYIFGGYGPDSKTQYSDLHRLNLSTNEWEVMPPCEEIGCRVGAGMTAIGDKIYIVGGFPDHQLGDTYCFDTTTHSWSVLPVKNSLQGRSVFGIVSIDSCIVTLCGKLESGEGNLNRGQLTNECCVLDTKNLDTGWRKLLMNGGASPIARAWLPAASTGDGSVVVYGGLSAENRKLCDSYFLQTSG